MRLRNMRPVAALLLGMGGVAAFVPAVPAAAKNGARAGEATTQGGWGCSSGWKSRGTLSMGAANEPSDGPVTRNQVLSRFGAAAVAVVATVAGGGEGGELSLAPPAAEAIGPVKMELTNPVYGAVMCPPKTQVPGEKAGAGLKPVCVRVEVTATNPGKKDILDAAVFGFVFDEGGTSVVANNPDGASDAGQFAILDRVPPGQNRVTFQFISAIPPKEDFAEKKLRFESLKAISYPGGARYGAIDECEMNPLADGCELGADQDDDED